MLLSSSLRFVRPGEGEEGTENLMKDAVQAVQEKGGEPVWVGPGDLEAGPERRCIYVLENFNSAEYKALAGNCRIVGPPALLAHAKHGWPLPADVKPVFSMAMHGVVACFTLTGAKETREKLTQLVQLMGGRVEGDLTKRATHLIAGQVGSQKYHVARQSQLPVLLPSWVESCWEASLSGGVVSATDEAILSKHRCLPFTGCNVSVTGLDEGTRERVKQACQENGGRYFGELTKDVCTHLIVGSKTSAKYRYAQQWGMHCVLLQWFQDSLQAKYCMPEADYDAGGGVATKGAKGRTKSAKTEPEWASAIAAFKIPDIEEDEFLNDCELYLCGFSAEQLRKLVGVVNRGGGRRTGSLSEGVTHLVMGGREDKVLERARQLNTRVHVVGPQWLLDCCVKGKRLSEESYHPFPPDKSCDQQSGPAFSGATGSKKRVSQDGPPPVAKRPRPLDDSGMEDVEDIMKQYAAPPTEEVELQPLGLGVLDGCGGVCVSRSFSEDDRKIAIRVVRENGGSVCSPDTASYLLAPLEGACSQAGGAGLEKVGGAVVTMIWLQRCIEENSLLDHTSYFLFRPLTTPISSTTLSGCVLAFSQFSDLEREHLIRFSKGLGATVQDHFARYPAHGLLGTTHLLLKEASGAKFTSAVKWGIPAVRDSWLFESAEAQRIVPVEPHLLVKSTPKSPDPSHMGETRPLSKESPPPAHMSGTEGEEEEEEEEGAEEEEEVLKGVVICFSKKLSSLSDLQASALHLGATFRSKLDKSVTHYVCQGKATEVLREREAKAARDRRCHLVSPHWLLQCQHTGSRLLEADFPVTFNPSMALAVSMPASQAPARQEPPPRLPSPSSTNDPPEPTSDPPEPTSDPPESTSDPPERLRELHQQLKELREAPQGLQKRRRSRRLQKLETSSDQPPVAPAPAPPPAKIPPSSPRTPGKGHGRHRRGRRGERVQLLDSQVSDSQLLQVTYDDPDGRREKEKLLDRIKREEELLAQGIHLEGGARADDMGEERARLKLDLSPPTEEDGPESRPEPSSNGVGGGGGEVAPSDEGVVRRDLPPSGTPDAPPIGVPIVTHATRKPSEVQPLFDQRSRLMRTQKPRFLLSSLEQREKIDYGALIQELGGEYIDQDYFTTKCTHLVVGKASRTEKYLGACAAGKWVLHKAYLEDCRAARHFVLEEGHEWGEKGVGSALEAAPRRWRLELARRREEAGRRGSGAVGAFVGWKVVVFAEKGKLPGLKRLLEAGGATVVSSHAPSALKGVTHAFITKNHFPSDSLSLEDLVKAGVLCLRPDFIAEYLSKGHEVSVEPFKLSSLTK